MRVSACSSCVCQNTYRTEQQVSAAGIYCCIGLGECRAANRRTAICAHAGIPANRHTHGSERRDITCFSFAALPFNVLLIYLEQSKWLLMWKNCSINNWNVFVCSTAELHHWQEVIRPLEEDIGTRKNYLRVTFLSAFTKYGGGDYFKVEIFISAHVWIKVLRTQQQTNTSSEFSVLFTVHFFRPAEDSSSASILFFRFFPPAQRHVKTHGRTLLASPGWVCSFLWNTVK